MTATILLLAYAPLLASGLAPQRTLQEGPTTRASAAITPAPSARAPVDVSLRGLDEAATGIEPLIAFPTCSLTIKDLTTGDCIAVDSTPTLGRLYPLGPEFNIDGAGNVGIGTTTPSAKLEVAGTAYVTDTLTLAPSGDQALDVITGSIYKKGVLFIHTKGGSNNTALGRSALEHVTNGFSNTASGDEALHSNLSGFSNTASGHQALFSNTKGDLNTASGHQALYSNTIGFHNTASGALALYSNTTGSRNTASGRWALFNNTVGQMNTANGWLALFNNTVGQMNTANGARALEGNTTGDHNTACGYKALLFNTTGQGNVASGDAALVENTTGNNNTATGSSALRANTTGINNTATGRGALRNNTTGSDNTACGYRALWQSTPYSTGSRNIALGYLAGSSLATGDDNIAIGNEGTAGDSSTILIGTGGTHTRAFIAGIRGVTTDVVDAVNVMIDSAGQLGTVSSSRRFKRDISDMGATTEKLLELRPVVFHYKQHVEAYGDAAPTEYGLIAEEVAEVFPDLVVYDDEGEPFTVKYHLLSSMLLNELQRLRGEKDSEMDALRASNAEQSRRLERLEALAGESLVSLAAR